MVEQVGSGISRIKDLMKKAKLAGPQFKIKGMFTIILHRTVEETVDIILNAMKSNPKITVKELQETTGLTRRGVEYHIVNLKKEKRITRTGSTKAGKWEVLF